MTEGNEFFVIRAALDKLEARLRESDRDEVDATLNGALQREASALIRRVQLLEHRLALVRAWASTPFADDDLLAGRRGALLAILEGQRDNELRVLDTGGS